MDYKARFYSVGLGRFLQPDSIIPDQFNPQSWNRFSYVSGNPLKYTDPTGHMQVCERGDEGVEGVLHSSRCGSGANTEQIEKAFDKKHGGKGYSEYYAKIHEVVKALNLYLQNINIEYEKETDAMRDKRISISKNILIASVESARITGQNLHYALRQDAWKSDAEFPKILGGGYIVDNSGGGLGDGITPGSGELSSVPISEIVKYYTRTQSLHYGPPGR